MGRSRESSEWSRPCADPGREVAVTEQRPDVVVALAAVARAQADLCAVKQAELGIPALRSTGQLWRSR